MKQILVKILYNIASRATQSNSVYVSVLQISTVLTDGVSKSLCQKFFFARAAIVSAGKNIIFRYTDGYRDSAHWFQNKHDFPAFSYGLEFLNEAEKEKNNGKGNSAWAPSRFASLSVRHFGKAKQITNWSASTFKGKRKFYGYKIVKYKPRAFNRKIDIKPIPILLNISLASNNHLWYCCPLFRVVFSGFMYNSTGYVIKQLVCAFSCALSSYGTLGKFGEHSRS